MDLPVNEQDRQALDATAQTIGHQVTIEGDLYWARPRGAIAGHRCRFATSSHDDMLVYLQSRARRDSWNLDLQDPAVEVEAVGLTAIAITERATGDRVEVSGGLTRVIPGEPVADFYTKEPARIGRWFR
ncbi:hypothetical protein [Tsukamurella pseudospumae]|uniref:Uncharacterized protein n=1 Tax=Tsukamurella pseudospumae TaxID=239498 RepID=A0A137ZZB0_9ACTN|nr:hypothetical protein [Tsukamurella pseudospumae]KXO98020.1 hypothetical protein AXK61_20885 [Tsukamurella pseudospumae]KXP03492.1 hypothetical protein AXK60_16875 [Tsukamurella pseudospumae]